MCVDPLDWADPADEVLEHPHVGPYIDRKDAEEIVEEFNSVWEELMEEQEE